MTRALRRLGAVSGVLGIAVTGFTAVVTVSAPQQAQALDNGLALTPPMGWNGYEYYSRNVTASIVEAEARALVSSGMKADGYDYVNLDGGWDLLQRGADGQLQPDPAKFPDGIKPVADYVHSLGLKFGIYTSVGTTNCAGTSAGSFGHYQQDVDTFASWGVDYVKVDWCAVPTDQFPGLTSEQIAQQLYGQFGDALRASPRPMVYSLSTNTPTLQPWTWAPAVGNLWRTTGDISDTYSSMLSNFTQNVQYGQDAGPGAWNDPDMLEVGNAGMSATEQQSQFSLWAEMAAPLLASTDLTDMSPATEQILTNRAVIAVDQDPLGQQGHVVSNADGLWVLSKPLADGSDAVVLFNQTDTPATISTTAGQVGLGHAGAYALSDLWAHTTTESAGTIAATVPAHGTVMYRVAPLTSEVNQYPPLTEATAAPQLPAAYPGSIYHIAQPGQTISVAASFSNDGRPAVTSASLNVGVPSGWSIGGGPATAPAVPGGKSLSGTWQVTIPADAVSGAYTVTANATYQWSDGTQTGAAQGAGVVQVLVPPSGTLYLSDLPWLSASSTSACCQQPFVDKTYYGTPLTIHGTVYQNGLWVNSIASITWYLGGNCTQLTTDLGLDDSDLGPGSVDYQIYTDGQLAYDSGLVVNSTPTLHVSVDTAGVQILQIDVGDAGDGVDFDNADIAAPQLTCAS